MELLDAMKAVFAIHFGIWEGLGSVKKKEKKRREESHLEGL
jgi:hypothetical protein